MKRYVLTNTNGTPMKGFYPNDCELSGILEFDRNNYEVYPTRAHAQRRLDFIKTQITKESARWGVLTTKQVENFVSCMFIRTKTS